jgi:hypothetical protein
MAPKKPQEVVEVEEDQEGYENRLGAMNESGEYATYIKWEREMRENRSCRGRLRWMVYRLWFMLLELNSLLSGFVTVVVTCGVFYSSLKAGNEDEAAFVQSLLSGSVAMCVFQGFAYMADKLSRFPETSRRHVIDKTHWSVGCIFLVYLVALIVACWALANINNYCGSEKKPCFIKAAFITQN